METKFDPSSPGQAQSAEGVQLQRFQKEDGQDDPDSSPDDQSQTSGISEPLPESIQGELFTPLFRLGPFWLSSMPPFGEYKEEPSFKIKITHLQEVKDDDNFLDGVRKLFNKSHEDQAKIVQKAPAFVSNRAQSQNTFCKWSKSDEFTFDMSGSAPDTQFLSLELEQYSSMEPDEESQVVGRQKISVSEIINMIQRRQQVEIRMQFLNTANTRSKRVPFVLKCGGALPSLFQLIESHNTEDLMLYLKRLAKYEGRVAVLQQVKNGVTPLLLAVENGLDKIVNHLITVGGRPELLLRKPKPRHSRKKRRNVDKESKKDNQDDASRKKKRRWPKWKRSGKSLRPPTMEMKERSVSDADSVDDEPQQTTSSKADLRSLAESPSPGPQSSDPDVKSSDADEHADRHNKAFLTRDGRNKHHRELKTPLSLALERYDPSVNQGSVRKIVKSLLRAFPEDLNWAPRGGELPMAFCLRRRYFDMALLLSSPKLFNGRQHLSSSSWYHDDQHALVDAMKLVAQNGPELDELEKVDLLIDVWNGYTFTQVGDIDSSRKVSWIRRYGVLVLDFSVRYDNAKCLAWLKRHNFFEPEENKDEHSLVDSEHGPQEVKEVAIAVKRDSVAMKRDSVAMKRDSVAQLRSLTDGSIIDASNQMYAIRQHHNKTVDMQRKLERSLQKHCSLPALRWFLHYCSIVPRREIVANIAAQHGSVPVLELCFSGDDQAINKSWTAPWPQGENVVMAAGGSLVLSAAKNNAWKALCWLVEEQGQDLLYIDSQGGHTVLSYAIEQGVELTTFKWLLSELAKHPDVASNYVNNERLHAGHPILVFAALQKEWKMVHHLLTCDVDVEVVPRSLNKNGQSILMLAVEAEQEAIVIELIHHLAELRKQDPVRLTAYLEMEDGDGRTVEVLTKYQKNNEISRQVTILLDTADSTTQLDPLQHSAITASAEDFEIALDASSNKLVSLLRKDYSGRNCLMLAACFGNLVVVQRIMHKYSKKKSNLCLNRRCAREKFTALDYSIYSNAKDKYTTFAFMFVNWLHHTPDEGLLTRLRNEVRVDDWDRVADSFFMGVDVMNERHENNEAEYLELFGTSQTEYAREQKDYSQSRISESEVKINFFPTDSHTSPAELLRMKAVAWLRVAELFSMLSQRDVSSRKKLKEHSLRFTLKAIACWKQLLARSSDFAFPAASVMLEARSFQKRRVAATDVQLDDPRDNDDLSMLEVGLRSHNIEFVTHPAVDEYATKWWEGDVDPDLFAVDRFKLQHFTINRKFQQLQSPEWLFRVPKVLYRVHAVSVMLLAALVSYILIDARDRQDSLSIWEYALYVYGVGMVHAEYTELTWYGPKKYLNDKWNYVDVSMICVITMHAVIRYLSLSVESVEDSNLDWLYTLSMIILCWTAYVRMLFLLFVFEKFGPIMIAMRRMLQDVIVFVVLMGTFLTSFFFVFVFLLSDVDATMKGFENRRHTLFTLFQASVVGHADNMSAWDDLPQDRQILAEAVTSIFLLLCAVVLVNVLIALLNTTYASVNKKAEREFVFLRVESFYRYDQGHVLPAPLNLLALPPLWIARTWHLLIGTNQYGEYCFHCGDVFHQSHAQVEMRPAAEELHRNRMLCIKCGRFANIILFDDDLQQDIGGVVMFLAGFFVFVPLLLATRFKASHHPSLFKRRKTHALRGVKQHHHHHDGESSEFLDIQVKYLSNYLQHRSPYIRVKFVDGTVYQTPLGQSRPNDRKHYEFAAPKFRFVIKPGMKQAGASLTFQICHPRTANNPLQVLQDSRNVSLSSLAKLGVGDKRLGMKRDSTLYIQSQSNPVPVIPKQTILLDIHKFRGRTGPWFTSNRKVIVRVGTDYPAHTHEAVPAGNRWHHWVHQDQITSGKVYITAGPHNNNQPVWITVQNPSMLGNRISGTFRTWIDQLLDPEWITRPRPWKLFKDKTELEECGDLWMTAYRMPAVSVQVQRVEDLILADASSFDIRIEVKYINRYYPVATGQSTVVSTCVCTYSRDDRIAMLDENEPPISFAVQDVRHLLGADMDDVSLRVEVIAVGTYKYFDRSLGVGSITFAELNQGGRAGETPVDLHSSRVSKSQRTVGRVHLRLLAASEN